MLIDCRRRSTPQDEYRGVEATNCAQLGDANVPRAVIVPLHPLVGTNAGRACRRTNVIKQWTCWRRLHALFEPHDQQQVESCLERLDNVAQGSVCAGSTRRQSGDDEQACHSRKLVRTEGHGAPSASRHPEDHFATLSDRSRLGFAISGVWWLSHVIACGSRESVVVEPSWLATSSTALVLRYTTSAQAGCEASRCVCSGRSRCKASQQLCLSFLEHVLNKASRGHRLGSKKQPTSSTS